MWNISIIMVMYRKSNFKIGSFSWSLFCLNNCNPRFCWYTPHLGILQNSRHKGSSHKLISLAFLKKFPICLGYVERHHENDLCLKPISISVNLTDLAEEFENKFQALLFLSNQLSVKTPPSSSLFYKPALTFTEI